MDFHKKKLFYLIKLEQNQLLIFGPFLSYLKSPSDLKVFLTKRMVNMLFL